MLKLGKSAVSMEIESVQMYYKQSIISIITIIMHHFMQTDRHNNSYSDFYSRLMLGFRAQMTKTYYICITYTE